jgi:predicted RNA-binding Zn-ribbon protein involved in translation (DUF1610 family)
MIGAGCALAFLAPSEARATGEHDYSSKHALIYKSVTPIQFAALPDKTPVAMLCAQCKTVTVLTKRDLATKPGKGVVQEAMPTHACPGCGGALVLKRDSKETTWVHSCKHCGNHTLDCCAPAGSAKAAGKQTGNADP